MAQCCHVFQNSDWPVCDRDEALKLWRSMPESFPLKPSSRDRDLCLIKRYHLPNSSPLWPHLNTDYRSTFTTAWLGSLGTCLNGICYLFSSPHYQGTISGHLSDSSSLPLLHPRYISDVTQAPEPSSQSAPHSSLTISAFGIRSHDL